jgi:hypothetical protein
MVMEPKYVVVWIYEFLWSKFAITVIIYWITKEQMWKYHKVS